MSETGDDSATVQLLAAFEDSLRIRLFHALTARRGSATTAQLARDVNASASVTEAQLAVLVELGVLEPDDQRESDDGQQYWRHARASFSFDPSELGPDSQDRVERLHVTQARAHAEMLQEYFADRGQSDDPYRRAAFGSDMVLTVTLAQFEKFQDELTALLMRYRDAAPETAPDARHVFAFAHAFRLPSRTGDMTSRANR